MRVWNRAIIGISLGEPGIWRRKRLIGTFFINIDFHINVALDLIFQLKIQWRIVDSSGLLFQESWISNADYTSESDSCRVRPIVWSAAKRYVNIDLSSLQYPHSSMPNLRLQLCRFITTTSKMPKIFKGCLTIPKENQRFPDWKNFLQNCNRKSRKVTFYEFWKPQKSPPQRKDITKAFWLQLPQEKRPKKNCKVSFVQRLGVHKYDRAC